MTTLTTVPLPPTHSPEWHALRQPYVGASDVAALFGASRYMNVADLAQQKVDGSIVPATKKMDNGTFFEDAIAKAWQATHGGGFELYKPDVMFVRGRLAANPDRLIHGSTTDHVEVKMPSEEWRFVPTAYWMQAQAQMACYGSVRTHFAVLDSTHDGVKSFIVMRDDEFIAEMEERVEVFWTWVEECRPYLEDGLDPVTPWPYGGRAVTGETILVEEADEDVVRAYLDHRAQAKFHEEAASELRPYVLAMTGAAGLPPKSRVTVQTTAGEVVARVRVSSGRTSLVKQLLQAEHPDLDLAAFERQGDPIITVEAPK